MSDDVLFLTPRPYVMVLARVCLLFPNFCWQIWHRPTSIILKLSTIVTGGPAHQPQTLGLLEKRHAM